jgi:hypothetical protein
MCKVNLPSMLASGASSLLPSWVLFAWALSQYRKAPLQQSQATRLEYKQHSEGIFRKLTPGCTICCHDFCKQQLWREPAATFCCS